MPCHRAVEYLSQRGVPFAEKNVRTDPVARQELLAMGFTSVPLLLIGDRRLTGFNPAEIEAALRASASTPMGVHPEP